MDNTKAAIYRIYREMQERDSYVTAENIKNAFPGFNQKHQTLLELFDSHNREKKQQLGINLSRTTYETYAITRKRIAEFLTYRYNLTDIPVKGVNRQFLDDFEIYLLTQCEYKKNTITGIMKKLRHIIELALNSEWIYKNPFREHKLQWQKVDRGFLLQSEIEALMECHFEKERPAIARDIFIFCAFTGLAYTDVKHLTNENIKTSVDGNTWIRGKRKKTDVEYNIPLLNIPKTILEKYRGKTSGDVLLPVFNIKQYNVLLKTVAKQCGIEKNVSSHPARHTFATLALTKGVSIESVSKMLGHTKISTAQIYARITDNKIGNEMNVFAGNVRELDAKMKPVPEINIDEVFKSLKISSSETVWKTLSVKIWDKMSNLDRQTFVSEVESRENKPKATREFYVVLMDYFLENMKYQNDVSVSTQRIE
jgi:site-specific recombinase XerD